MAEEIVGSVSDMIYVDKEYNDLSVESSTCSLAFDKIAQNLNIPNHKTFGALIALQENLNTSYVQSPKFYGKLDAAVIALGMAERAAHTTWYGPMCLPYRGQLQAISQRERF